MMYECRGDILTFDANIICYQASYAGVTPGSFADKFARAMIVPEEYEEYKHCCRRFHEALLGTVLYSRIAGQKYVAHCFCQREIPATAEQTDHDALQKCLALVEPCARQRGWSVAIPAYMGVELHGGEWRAVRALLYRAFANSPVPLAVVYPQ